MIVGLIGVEGAGKSERQKQFIKEGFYPLDFKAEVQLMCQDLTGFPCGPAAWEQFKATKFSDYLTGRKIAQRLATEVIRKRYPNHFTKVWAKAARRKLDAGRSIVAADVRFSNEIQTIQKLAQSRNIKCRFIFCDYKSERYDATDGHASEALAQALIKAGYKDGDEVLPAVGINMNKGWR